jgi:hypothetical protein
MQPLDWDDLARELDLWAESGRVATLWWRDDDAVEPTPALTRLLDLAAASGVEIGLAVIPAPARESLAAVLDAWPHVAILQHGYQHRNYAPKGSPAVECGGARPVDTVLEQVRAGRRRMQELFAARAEPILAAPWNRIDTLVLARLGEAGFAGASAMGPRANMTVASVVIANAHLDPLNWKERRFAGLGKALSGLIAELRDRRTGTTEADEPVGLLTHHLDHDAETWAFVERLLQVTAAHPAARWIGARGLFSEAGRAASVARMERSAMRGGW